MNDQFGPVPTLEEIDELTSQMKALLRGRGAYLQSVVLADIVAMLFAGHNPVIRETAITHWLTAMRGLIDVNEQQILERFHVNSWDEIKVPRQ